MLLLTACNSKKTETQVIEQTKTMSEQDRAKLLEEVKMKFAEENQIAVGKVADPYFYDITNDGKEKIIVSTNGKDVDLMYGIYDDKANYIYRAKSEVSPPYSLEKIKNKTYGNSLAIIIQGANGYSAEVIAMIDQEVKMIGKISTPAGDEILVDADQDGFEEFIGFDNDGDLGNQRVLYKWNEEKKSYEKQSDIPTNTNGSEKIPVINEEAAYQILNLARKTQMTWLEPMEQEEVYKLFKPYFTNNFISETLNSEVTLNFDGGRYVPVYTQSGDLSGLVPEYKKPLSLKLSEDKTKATIVQSITQFYEDEEFTADVETILVKTSDGWKIDSFKYLN